MLRKLESLSLAHNLLQADALTGPCLSTLGQLKKLDLGHNLLNQVPQVICEIQMYASAIPEWYHKFMCHRLFFMSTCSVFVHWVERFCSYSGHADEASYHDNNNRPIGQSSTSTSDMLASVHLKMANSYVDLPTAKHISNRVSNKAFQHNAYREF